MFLPNVLPAMLSDLALLGVSALVLIYLLYALIHPEKF